MSTHNSSHTYRALDSHSEESKDSRENSIFEWDVSAEKRTNPLLWLCFLSWSITVLVTTLYIWHGRLPSSYNYTNGWKTEFVTVRDVIELDTKTFTGGPTYSDSGDLIVPNKSPVTYVGEPSPGLDEAWEKVVGGRYFLITEKEARATWGAEYEHYWSYDRGGYVAGLDLFHTLHCLNMIRMRLHPDYYNGANRHGESLNRTHHPMVHDGHCIDQIRQYIMCAGDLTVIGTRYYPSVDRNYVSSDVPHVCRNFDRIREWTWERFNGSTAVQPAYKPKPKDSP